LFAKPAFFQGGLRVFIQEISREFQNTLHCYPVFLDRVMAIFNFFQVFLRNLDRQMDKMIIFAVF
jgi:hypothetical protein